MSSGDRKHASGGAVTVSRMRAMKREGRPLACLTAYDYGFAAACERAGVDLLLIGDSLGMVVQGHETTLPVTVDDMVYHTRCVARACRRALVVADLPFMSHTGVEQGLHNAGRLMKEGGAQMVKLEGGAEQAALVERLAQNGIPVCGHLGLKPQQVHKIGGYRVQGREQADAERMEADALALEAAGADLLILECVPAVLAQQLSERLTVPVVGIGAGGGCDGQILVLHDVLGVTEQPPRFARAFGAEGGGVHAALEAYVAAVRAGTFPGPEHGFEA
ncbi:3-methyl-2-oxobutanoate hydroxymethyltransferase [Halorhodospira halophila]|uniref:3-methyl-2-oxobutanoate hydroxymethyltransferase n=1 Tax=Halorhodospira halophila (strain DSM 244 / SL1) TaxID=349124 RepID=PANB_HALHL|nr:3-methyl-2-oxobutanoate hydroxymethyltransferase [Halorhodospira halophila]A1WUU5.1 RecName: Full=3-methyl-2-oxobutanoate hydroxymethyltransferase; AltName: Full=Ketopantoate hydroxymethyltransferase; Short=KPHMT [Halorhodospira halophila SL1]ABM61457.1 ketopantoate hydroxymethyltransferase [Halorhodospira halophila SL1]MBK1728704.1 3-methyl-2-oxobutanoate hydroxymethyltransferase [Halorhodospira halophila]